MKENSFVGLIMLGMIYLLGKKTKYNHLLVGGYMIWEKKVN